MHKYHAQLKLNFGAPLTRYAAGYVHKLPRIKLKDGKTNYYDADQILLRWYEHFKELFNQEAHVSEQIDSMLPEQNSIVDHLGSRITTSEFTAAIQAMKNGKPLDVMECLLKLRNIV
jgi:hypothetical protein